MAYSESGAPGAEEVPAFAPEPRFEYDSAEAELVIEVNGYKVYVDGSYAEDLIARVAELFTEGGGAAVVEDDVQGIASACLWLAYEMRANEHQLDVEYAKRTVAELQDLVRSMERRLRYEAA